MNTYEKLLDEYSHLYIVEDYHFENESRIKGLYADGVIALSDSLNTTDERSCILAEEIGHHETTLGNILETTDFNNRKQEHTARIWAYQKLVSLKQIICAFNQGCRNIYEFADYLNVTEPFLLEALKYYRQKYGTHTTIDEFTFIFYPHLNIIKKI